MTTPEYPAALLRRAADRIDRLAAPLPDHPWTTERIFWKVGSTRGMEDGWWWEVCDADGTVALASEQDDDPDTDTAERRTAWIAAMGPTVAAPLSSWLRAEADDYERRETLMLVGGGATMAWAAEFARTLLGETEETP